MRAQRSLFVSVSARKEAREIAKPERSRNGSTRASTVLFGNESNLNNDVEITIRNPPPCFVHTSPVVCASPGRTFTVLS